MKKRMMLIALAAAMVIGTTACSGITPTQTSESQITGTIETTVETDYGSCTVTIRDTHTNIVRITVDGKSIFEVNTQKERSGSETEGRDVSVIHRYRLEDILKLGPF